MNRSYDTIVIGAGVIGCSVAYHLQTRGIQVALVERGVVAGGTSSASAGHVSVQGRVPGPLLTLAIANVNLLSQLAEELGADFELVRSGGLILAENQVEYELLRKFVSQQATHVQVEFLEANEIRKLEPYVSRRRFLGGSYCPLEGYLNPMALAIGLARGAQKLGAQLLLHTEVTGIAARGGQVAGVRIREGVIGADVVVIAAGVWSPEVGQLAGIRVPVIPRKGQLLVTEALPPMVRSLLSHAGHIPFKEHGIEALPEVEGELQKKRYMKQARSGGFQGRFYIGSTSEFVGFDRTNTWDGVTELCRYAVETVPALAQARLVRSWAGLRPRSVDGRFLIGAAPGIRGLYLATGHDSVGIQYSGMTGKLLAEWIQMGRQPELLKTFDPARVVTTASH